MSLKSVLRAVSATLFSPSYSDVLEVAERNRAEDVEKMLAAIPKYRLEADENMSIIAKGFRASLSNGAFKAADVFLQRDPALLTTPFPDGDIPLLHCAGLSFPFSYHIAKYLLDRGVDPWQDEEVGRDYLVRAANDASSLRIELVLNHPSLTAEKKREILEAPIDESLTAAGCVVETFVADGGDVETTANALRSLRRHGADMASTDLSGQSHAEIVFKNFGVDVLASLVEAGLRFGEIGPKLTAFKAQCLQAAALTGPEKIICQALAADPSQPDAWRETWAAKAVAESSRHKIKPAKKLVLKTGAAP